MISLLPDTTAAETMSCKLLVNQKLQSSECHQKHNYLGNTMEPPILKHYKATASQSSLVLSLRECTGSNWAMLKRPACSLLARLTRSACEHKQSGKLSEPQLLPAWDFARQKIA